jgi:ATP-dependent RNA helicase RhlE
MSFKKLMLDEHLIKALDKIGYSEPTAIQEKCIPLVLQGRDVLASAETGTGKTAAFTLPLIHMLLDRNQIQKPQKGKPRVLILTPTRELALQIADNVRHYTQFLKINHTVIYGGVSQQMQLQSLAKSPEILIATPGRLKDLLEQRHVTLDEIRYFVLDEADRMLDSGFLKDVTRIVRMLPATRQTLLFSATLPPAIKELANKLLNKPAVVQVERVQTASEGISQSVYYVEKHLKHDLLVTLLKGKAIDRVLIFTTMKHHADKIARRLSSSGIGSEAIHGNKTQSQREKTLEKFKARKMKALIATDVVARGIDIDDLTHVINYELPDVPETYVHRIGRTGRKGRSGVAISFCSEEEKTQLKQIQTLIASRINVINHHETN